MEVSSTLKKYLKPKASTVWISIILFAVAIFAAIYGIGDKDYVGIICFVILLAVSIAVLCVAISSMKSYSQEMKRLEEEGLYDQMENDFSLATQFFNDKLRFSSDYIYPKYGGKALRYEDVVKVYQFIQKKNGIENNRELRVETTAGKIVTLADIALRGKDDDKVNEVVAALLEKNPSIHVGYK